MWIRLISWESLQNKWFYPKFNGIAIFEKKIFTANFFRVVLNLEDGWSVQSVKSAVGKVEIYSAVNHILKKLEDRETGEICKVYDQDPP
jgi:hypothetical protein